MKLSSFLMGSSALVLATACGLGGNADVGDDSQNVGKNGTGGAAGSGGAAGDPGTTPTGEKCGANTCQAGEFCCNASCGICAPEGGSCTQEFCGDPGQPPPDGGTGCTSIALCAAGFVWSDTECQCVPAPSGCTETALCIQGYVWSDTECRCVPAPSGCVETVLCVQGYVWSATECQCVPAGDPCGPTTCAAGQVCCNESCGICTAPGGACTQQFCEPPASECNVDSDCTLFADCRDCSCGAASPSDTLPTCETPCVNIADPCMFMQAACVDGQCVANSL